MKHYMFGFDAANPESCAEYFTQKGIDAVVAGNFDDRAVRAFRARKIELYLCYGAHGVSGASDSPEHLSVDALGESRKWFSSGCPCDEEIISAHLNEALGKVSGDISGVLVDGARFASFASAEGGESFFTCFCPRCMEKMARLDMDAEAIRAAVAELQRTRFVGPDNASHLSRWLKFRESVVQAYFDRFAEAVHALRPGLLAGAFVFAPSLAGFVGQTPSACRSLDIVAPMLYRAYHYEHGPATLNHEWAGLARIMGESSHRFCRLGGAFAEPLDRSADDILKKGFPPEHIRLETEAARLRLREGQRLLPILQIEDDLRPESFAAALSGGADGAGWFAYGQAEL